MGFSIHARKFADGATAPESENSMKGDAQKDEWRNIRPILIFQIGASQYFLGREEDASIRFENLLREYKESEYAPYAYVLIVKTLAVIGNTRRRKLIMKKLCGRSPGTVGKGSDRRGQNLLKA